MSTTSYHTQSLLDVDDEIPHLYTTGVRRTASLASNNPFRDASSSSSRRRSPSTSPPSAYASTRQHRRTPSLSSLRERYPNDPSLHPLATISAEHRAAHRAPHLRKNALHGRDAIDRLDSVAGIYHHEGPYDAASFARNRASTTSSHTRPTAAFTATRANRSSSAPSRSVEESEFDPLAPVAALKMSNAETLRATPAGRIADAVKMHRPLDGTAAFPPGETDPLGQTYGYAEGTDMMREGTWGDGGNYRRWEGLEYDPDDLKGHSNMRGEEHTGMSLDEYIRFRRAKKHASKGEGQEMVTFSEKGDCREQVNEVEGESSGRGRLSGELRRRFGSLRKSKK